MSERPITPHDFREILSGIAARIKKEEPYLNSLDAALGDGDHGITMRVGFEAIVSRLGQLESQASIASLLREAGLAFLNATGGAIGVVFGKMLMAGGKALAGREQFGSRELQVLLESMEISAANMGKVLRRSREMTHVC